MTVATAGSRTSRSPSRRSKTRVSDKDAATDTAAKAVSDEKARGSDKVDAGVLLPLAVAGAMLYYYYTVWQQGPKSHEEMFTGESNLPITTPAFGTLAYLVFVFGGNSIMARRGPVVRLKNWMLVYNMYQAVLNVAMVVGLVWGHYTESGTFMWGTPIVRSEKGYTVAFWVWVHYHNKYVEFIDTAFMVLRKSTRQISFLHLYHHVLLVWSWYAVVRVAPGGDAYYGSTINSGIHVLMYTYYALRLLKVPVSWKAMVTQLQMLQFVACLLQSLHVLYMESYPRELTLLQLFVMVTMLILFGNFYSKSYNKSAKVVWTVIDGAKYDITAFMERHPGGSDMLMLAAGRDASVMFHSYHRRLHVSQALLRALPQIDDDVDDNLMKAVSDGIMTKTHAANNSDSASGAAANGQASNNGRAGRAGRGRDASVGRNASAAAVAANDDQSALGQHENVETELYQTLRQRVNDYFDRTGYSSRGGALMYTKTAVLLTSVSTAYYFAVFGTPEYALHIAPFIGLMMAMIGLTIQHDANHGSFSPYPMLNRAMGLMDDIIGGSALMWRHQHNIAHHVHPNDHELDADTVSNFPLIRMNPKLPVRWYLRAQHIYGPMMYSLLGMMYPIGDIAGYLSGSYEHVKLHPLRLVDKLTFIAGKVAHYTLVLGVPIYFMGAHDGFFKVFLPMQLMGGLFLASVFAVSHNAEANDYNCPRDLDWAETQIRTSCNWSPHSTFWWLVSGGLNYQIEHHLFPGVCHVHYPALHKIVKATCDEYELPYNSYPSYFQIYMSHVKTLYYLGHGMDHKVFHKDHLQ